jgi:hypothetical protein
MGVIQFEDWADTGEEYVKFELGETVEEAREVHDVAAVAGD